MAHLRSLSPFESPAALADIAAILIRPAALDDVNGVLELLSEAAVWTEALGHPNWPAQFPRAVVTHRLVVRRDRAGEGLGAALVDWASQQVRAAGRDRLRLDVSADNLPLCSYYERLGFVHRGDREGELTEPGGAVRHWRSRLYERRCAEAPS